MNTNCKTALPCTGGRGARKRGPTSYKMHDSDLVFEALGLENGDVFLDMGCGPGDYSLHAAGAVGSKGTVYALDSNINMLKEVAKQTAENSVSNIRTIHGEMSDVLPFEDESVDTCFMSTSLHCMDLQAYGTALFKEVQRILKTSGQVAILECKKEKADFGPPLHMRISSEDIKSFVLPLEFHETAYLDLGFNYLIKFKK
ncbi:class I SAM-dependent methyltransferase [Halodesulfovibrio sp. MK-HDV]|jgi:ubiquinone/menaquinone biosynthesis C-methylase UbiE|uniref:class I SAM-dependent methyltransferase n=1 Tax=Halodesulfovibrio sp. MK-HDV TaxID=2599925 RepID=UPI00136ED73A|nr:class I SAM-dependent methyltransferase [Halodesulfovibrio sp. MK-HDV]KAF1077082.1 Demethylmenaquinone methyltransferase [Halodesulfovibrio sp. MK-HDV]